MSEVYSCYFVAKILREKIWLTSGLIRNQGHIAFERSLDAKENLFEFFVPKAFKQDFINFASYMKEQGLFIFFEEKENRLKPQ